MTDLPPMAACGKFVSLLRSCYSTKMRFFKDDETLELPVRWYFTDPAAEWVGFPNVFNSRNWYLPASDEWPTLGEVAGAPRPWADGQGLCSGIPGPFGTALEWDEGSYLVDRIASQPCFGARDSMGYSDVRMEVEVDFEGTVDMVLYGDVWSLPYPDYVTGPDWISVFPTDEPQCCFPRGTKVAITGPPPGFPIVRNLDVSTPLIGDCSGGQGFDPVEGLDLFFLSGFQ